MRWLKGQFPEKQAKIFVPFTPSSANFLWQNIWEWEQVQMQKKKKVFMNNGTFQIHLVSETFFSFLTTANYIACLSENWFYPEAHSALKFLH